MIERTLLFVNFEAAEAFCKPKLKEISTSDKSRLTLFFTLNNIVAWVALQGFSDENL